MKKFIRAAEPAVCAAHSARWNAQWVALHQTNPNGFSWYVVDKKSARDHLLPVLREQTQGHCSFCDACQAAKREQWDERLLRADAGDFLFSRYFEFDFTTGELKPNSLASQADQECAAITIKLYGLDSPARCRNRLDEARRYSKCSPVAMQDEIWAYRDFLFPSGQSVGLLSSGAG